MRRLLSAALLAGLLPATAAAEPIVIVASWHNWDFAEDWCSRAQGTEWATDCMLAGNGRTLAYRLENAVMSQLAVNPRCQGVSVFRETNSKYESGNSRELDPQKAKAHPLGAALDYSPGNKTHFWYLFPYGESGWFAHVGEMGQDAAGGRHSVPDRGPNLHRHHEQGCEYPLGPEESLAGSGLRAEFVSHAFSSRIAARIAQKSQHIWVPGCERASGAAIMAAVCDQEAAA